jgi:type I restriction-modification system DNA methylase subunit
MPKVNEWEFTGDVMSRINLILRDHPELPFKEAKIEEYSPGTTKRRDLTLYDRNGKAVLTGEVKLPDNPAGNSPFRQSVIEDAHHKADELGTPYNFTWNVNRFVLWNTFDEGKPISQREIEHFNVLSAPIHTGEATAEPRIQTQIDAFLLRFLIRFADILAGKEPIRQLPLDEKFILVYEASLETPVARAFAATYEHYRQDREFARELDKWMREDQEWVLSKDESALTENLERAAKFSCYVLANKIVFYKALRRRFPKMRAMRIPKSITRGSDLNRHLNELFQQAISLTGDYETVFKSTFGDNLPFLDDAAVDSWRDLSEQTDGFDFTQLNHEIIGLIFERLLSTDERHKYGQHYTRSEVVDLINAFCIRTPTARVLDPACGGGTFLVRAYNRKKALSKNKLQHRELIQQIYGFDISAYPVHLTTINLVTRDLIDDANYPLVARQDFFNVRLHDAPFAVPFASRDAQLTMVAIGKVDAVVGNPPYVRQERITEYYGAKYKTNLQKDIAAREAPGAALSGRSDLYVYFFPHGASFLEDGGYMGLLTSSTWLDTAYGFRLQKYLLDNFEIIAIFESASEPWFTGARVTTAATILRRQSDPAKRASNVVHFVKIQRELSDILAPFTDEESRQRFFENVRDHIESLTTDETNENWRIRSISQAELYQLGQLDIEIEEDENGEDENGSGEPGQSTLREPSGSYRIKDDYIGYKWGIFLHAPSLYFSLLARAKSRLVPLETVANIQRGITSGADDFFYPYDITEDEIVRLKTPRGFKDIYSIRPSDTSTVRIVKAGDGSAHLVESRYFEPVVFNLMEIDSFEVDVTALNRRVLVCPMSKDALRKQGDKHLLGYLCWGEREGFDERPTCASRERWYDLSGGQRGSMLWTKAQRYRHIVPFNPKHLIANCNLYDIVSKESVDDRDLCAVLNSTLVALMKHLFGRQMGGDPVLKTEVVDVKMMLVPDVRLITKDIAMRLRDSLSSMRQRKARYLVDVDATGDDWSGELALADRQELDDAVLELLGISEKKERQALRAELYSEMTQLYREIRATEKKMQKFRAETARHGRLTPQSLADEIWETFAQPPQAKPLSAFVPPTAKADLIILPAGKPKAVVADMFNANSLQFGKQFILLGSPERVSYALHLSESGAIGQVPVPVEPAVCATAVKEYQQQQAMLAALFEQAAANYTTDEQLQARIVRELWRKASSETA